MRVDKRLRFAICMETFFCFRNDVTTAQIYDWICINQISGLQYITRSEINFWLRRNKHIKNVSPDGRRSIWRWTK